MISRRTFIKGAAGAGVAAIAVPEILSALGSHPYKPISKPLAVVPQPLRIPPVINGGDLNVAPSTFNIYPDAPSSLLLVNNSFPAPTIKLKMGDQFVATIHNNLTVDTVLHWHGVSAPAAMGGHPANVVAAGTSYSVNFPIVQRSCISFYHAHPHMATGEQVYMGLAGFFLVEDEDELALGLPSGDFDVPLMIQDKRVDANRQLIYNMTNADMASGWLGDTIMVNGTPNAFLAVAPTLYRFRIVNASNARFYKLALSDSSPFAVIGNDGGFLSAPLTLTSVNLAPAERLDILVDFSSYAQGQSVTLKSLAFTMPDAPGSGTVPQGAEMDLLQFQVTLTGSSGGNIPTTLPPIVAYNIADVKVPPRVWTFSAAHQINDVSYDIKQPGPNVPFGELEQWTFQSVGSNTHPVHIHGAQFQVMDRNGSAPDPWELGWKDVIRLDPTGPVNVLVQFNSYPGLFVIHCHKLEHADEGMMANFMVEPQSSVAENQSGVSPLEIVPNPASDHAILYFPILTDIQILTINDEKGVVLFKKSLMAGTNQYVVNTSQFADGRYTVAIGSMRAQLIILKAQ